MSRERNPEAFQAKPLLLAWQLKPSSMKGLAWIVGYEGNSSGEVGTTGVPLILYDSPLLSVVSVPCCQYGNCKKAAKSLKRHCQGEAPGEKPQALVPFMFSGYIEYGVRVERHSEGRDPMEYIFLHRNSPPTSWAMVPAL
jgi:hypothetical protein